jgi:sarcosine oxidase subunit beta
MGRVFSPTQETLPRTADVVVVGGGIVGVATAFWLSRAGLDTVLVEMRDGLSTLTTPSSMECFRMMFSEPAMVALARPSIDLFENFAQTVGLPGYDISIHQPGYLFVTEEEGKVDQLRKAVDTYHELGVTDAEFLSAEEVRRRFPYVTPNIAAGAYRQRDGWLSVHELTQGFAKGSSARFLLRTKVTGIVQDAQGIAAVETNFGRISTRTVVNAAGPFAGVIGGMAGLDLPLKPVRRQKVHIAPKAEIPQDAPFCVDLVRGAYWRPETGGALLGWLDPDEPVSEPTEEVWADRDFPALALDKLSSLFPFWHDLGPHLTNKDIHTSAGYYVYTPDDQPLIGPVPDLPGFHLNCGYWAGVMLAPEAGRWVADLITGAMRPEDNPLRPTRYEEGIVVEGDSFLRGRAGDRNDDVHKSGKGN